MLSVTHSVTAFKTLVATLLAVGAIVAVKGAEPLTFVSEHWIELVSASLAMSALQACAVYAQSYMRKDDMLALGGNTPSVIYNVRALVSRSHAEQRAEHRAVLSHSGSLAVGSIRRSARSTSSRLTSSGQA